MRYGGVTVEEAIAHAAASGRPLVVDVSPRWSPTRRDSSPRLIDDTAPADEDAGMTQLSPALPATSAARLTTHEVDAASTPPMEALGRIAAVRMRLDEDISSLIGRMQPYMKRDGVGTVREMPPSQSDEIDPRSPLIARMDTEAGTLMEIVVRVEELLNGLEL